MSIKNKFKRLIFLLPQGYNYCTEIFHNIDLLSGEFQIRLRAKKEKSISKARLCKNGI